MHLFRNMFVRCGLAIWLFVFAMTADVMVKAVVSGGFDANKPVVQIEHKCAGNKGSVSAAQSIAPAVAIVQIPAEPVPINFTSEPSAVRSQDICNFPGVSGAPPLRC